MHTSGETQRGFTYIGLLLAVAIMGLMLTIVGRVWSTTEQREREQQLLFVGHAYRLAIASYFSAGHRFPAALEDLLRDERSPVPRHHLRRLYPDPITGTADWTLVLTPDGQGIMGVASSAKTAPIKRRNFEFTDAAFTDADCYCLWQFIYYPNRFNRAGATGTSTLTPANANAPAPAGVGAFSPGSISALPGGSPMPGGVSTFPNNGSTPTPGNTPPSSSQSPDSN